MSSVKRILCDRTTLRYTAEHHKKKPINCFLFELEGESRYVTKRAYPSSSETTKLQFHWSIIITSSYHYLFIEKVKSSELLIKQPRYGGSRRRTQIPWLATMFWVWVFNCKDEYANKRTRRIVAHSWLEPATSGLQSNAFPAELRREIYRKEKETHSLNLKKADLYWEHYFS